VDRSQVASFIRPYGSQLADTLMKTPFITSLSLKGQGQGQGLLGVNE
jgi:hypothetical protein